MTGDERKQLREVLLAGSSRDSMTTALAEAENSRVFDDLVGEDGYSSQLRDLIEHAYRSGWLSELLDVFDSQTERKDLVQRASEIVAAVEERGPPVGEPGGGDPGNGPGGGSGNSSNDTLKTVLKIIGAVVLTIIVLFGLYVSWFSFGEVTFTEVTSSEESGFDQP